MRNFLLTFFFVLALGLSCVWGVPWWGLTLIGALAGWLLRPTPGTGFNAGFLAGFLLWLGLALALNSANDGVLSARIGRLFGNIGGWLLVLITGLFGGILASFGVLTGRFARDLVFPPAAGRKRRRRRRR